MVPLQWFCSPQQFQLCASIANIHLVCVPNVGMLSLMLIVPEGKCPPSPYEVDVAAYDIAPSREVTCLTDDDREQISTLQKQCKKKKEIEISHLHDYSYNC